jgi:hypothetical protein
MFSADMAHLLVIRGGEFADVVGWRGSFGP